MKHFIYRTIDYLARVYREKRFKYEIHCRHSHFRIVGGITVINKNIQLGENVTIYPGVMFWGDGPIVIGNNVDIGNNTVIYASKNGGVTIGADTQIAAQCYIIDMDHGIAKDEIINNQVDVASPISIGKDCWLGANVTVLKGSFINDGAVIGAKSLVKGEVPQNAVAVGIPAKVIKYRQ